MENNLKNKKVFIFDLDGTLVDSTSSWDLVDSEVIKLGGGRPREYIKEERDKILTIAGNKNPYRVYEKYLIDSYGLKFTPEEIAKARHDISKCVTTYIELKPGAAEILKFLKSKKKGLALATLSSREIYEVYCNENQNIMSNINFELIFGENVLTHEDVKFNKPDPEIYFRARAKFEGIYVSQMLVIEDSVIGIESARAAGIEVVGICDTQSEREKMLIKNKANYIFPSLEDLLKELKKK